MKIVTRETKKGGVLFFGDFVTCVTKNMKEG
ncbi:hypothetical protein DEU43_101838 [Bacillus amyloliquefaciens]|nr:hypothetical protein DEU43_101838 [Bacillus amyloliquefaciens]